MTTEYNEAKARLVEEAKANLASDWLNDRIIRRMNFATSPKYMNSAVLFKKDDETVSISVSCGVVEIYINNPVATPDYCDYSKIYINDKSKNGTFMEVPTDVILGWMTEVKMNEENCD